MLELLKRQNRKAGMNVDKFIKSPYFFLCLVTFIWGSNFVVSKYIISAVPPLTLNLGRFAVASLILLPWFITKAKVNVLQDRKLFGQIILLGITGVGLFNSLVYLGLQYTTAINSLLINSFNPLLMVLLSIIWLKEKVIWQQLLGMGISLTGVIWIASRGELNNLHQLNFNQGDLLVGLAALVWAVYSIMGKVVMVKVSPMETITWATFIGTIILIPFSAWEIYSLGSISLGWEFWAGIMYLGIFPSIVAHFLWFYCIMKIGVSSSANFYNLIPVFGAFLAVIFLHEELFFYQVGGGILVLLGIYFAKKGQTIS